MIRIRALISAYQTNDESKEKEDCLVNTTRLKDDKQARELVIEQAIKQIVIYTSRSKGTNDA